MLKWNQPQGRRAAVASILAPQQTVNPLQLTLGQDEAVDLLLPAGTRHHDPAHQHRVGLLLLLGLRTGELVSRTQRLAQCDCCAFTFTNKVEGKVAKSDEARAPRCWCTMCSATSSCQEEGEFTRNGHSGIALWGLPLIWPGCRSGTVDEPSVPAAGR